MSRFITRKLFPLLLILGSASGLAAAEPDYQSHEEILRVARDYLRDTLPGDETARILVRPPDTRLRLVPCATELQPFLPSPAPMAGRITLGIRCRAPQPWQLFLAAEIETRVQVPVARHALPKDHPLSGEDLSWEEFPRSRLPADVVLEATSVAGKLTRQPIQAGRPLRQGMLRTPLAVRKDELVQILYETQGIAVLSAGIALQNGALGEKIKVKNSKSQSVVEGHISDMGKVTIH